jgi:Na+/H+ antiporter NhaD/arsenite permease-like protein
MDVVMAGLSIIACNLINNQPMTIAFTRILLHPKFAGVVSPAILKGASFAVILGSNLGANFTLIGAIPGISMYRLSTDHGKLVLSVTITGALAGVMWARILQEKGLVIGYFQFAKYGLLMMIPVAMLSLLTLRATVF